MQADSKPHLLEQEEEEEEEGEATIKVGEQAKQVASKDASHFVRTEAHLLYNYCSRQPL
jgi:hypothetical protein